MTGPEQHANTVSRPDPAQVEAAMGRINGYFLRDHGSIPSDAKLVAAELVAVRAELAEARREVDLQMQESLATQLARDIAYGIGDDRDGWYGAAEARALADEVLRLRTLLRMGAVGGETEEIRAWCRLALEVSGESSTPASEMLGDGGGA